MKLTALATASLICVSSASVHAASFTDEDLWRAAVGNVYALETFDELPTYSDVFSLPSLDLRFLPLDDGTQPTVQPYNKTGGIAHSGPHNLLNDRDYSLPARGPINVVPLTPGNFLYGLGLWNVGIDDQLRLTFYDADDDIIEQAISAPVYGFFGIVSSTGAVRAEVDFIGGNGYAPTDDWQVAVRTTFDPEEPVGDVPEPGTWAMLIAGFGLMGTALRRRQPGYA